MKKVKKFIKNNIKVVIAFILGISIAGSIGVYAATVIASASVSYDNSDSGLEATNLQDALDETYNKVKNKVIVDSKNKKCRRATSLHNFSVGENSNAYTLNGNTSLLSYHVSFGQKGTTGQLTVGDAFDCDVNGDGTYDSGTERFYYVTTTNSKVILAYYKAIVAYYSVIAPSGRPVSDNSNGPTNAISSIPTISTWSNLNTTYTARQIKTEIGSTSTSGGTLPVFNYSKNGVASAARLLTYQEVVNACGSGTPTDEGYLLTNCKFLLEDTNYHIYGQNRYYSYLETPVSTSSTTVYCINGKTANLTPIVTYVPQTSLISLRLAIEMDLENIDY